MSYEIIGTIQSIGELQTFGTKGFCKREVILTIPDGKYPQTLSFEFQGERADLPTKYSTGDEITVTFDLKGRMHEASQRVYNTLNAWQIKGDRAAPAPRPMSKAGLAETSLDPVDSGDDVPF